jgi:hypothetical protein
VFKLLQPDERVPEDNTEIILYQLRLSEQLFDVFDIIHLKGLQFEERN